MNWTYSVRDVCSEYSTNMETETGDRCCSLRLKRQTHNICSYRCVCVHLCVCVCVCVCYVDSCSRVWISLVSKLMSDVWNMMNNWTWTGQRSSISTYSTDSKDNITDSNTELHKVHTLLQTVLHKVQHTASQTVSTVLKTVLQKVETVEQTITRDSTEITTDTLLQTVQTVLQTVLQTKLQTVLQTVIQHYTQYR